MTEAKSGCSLCEHLREEGATPVETPPVITPNMTLCVGCWQVWRWPEEEEKV